MYTSYYYNNMSNYSNISYELTNQIEKKIKKEQGIFFTPPITINHNLNIIDSYITKCKTVLEPSCGSCEYINALYNKYPHLNITGIEYNQTIFNSIKQYSNDNINLINTDFLLYNDNKTYDLIIGNPPFFVMKLKEVNKKYHEFFDGRPNIFILFIIKAISLLNENGILSFVLPKNFMNCLYYNKTREYINNNFTIIDIVDCQDKFIETQQDTIILIIQKQQTLDNNKFILNINDYTIFGIPNNISQLKSLYENSTTLYSMNFNVNVGTVVWNQHKDILTSDTSHTRLIYSSDIHNNKLIMKKYKNIDKQNFINKHGINRPTLVINRGYGTGVYNFEYCLIKGGFDYLIENHLICVNHMNSISNEQLISLYESIIHSLENEKTKLFIKLYFGNNAINTTELNYILPIYT